MQSPAGAGGDYRLLGLAYDVRKAYEGARESKAFGTGHERVNYLGVNILWPYFLVQVALLREFGKFQPTSAIHHSHLYLLEHLAENALAEKNPGTARFCREWLNHFPGLTRDYLTLFLNEATWTFVYKTSPARRLDSLPALLRSFHWFAPEYRAFEKAVRAEAKKHGCSPQQLTRDLEWPNFRW